MNKNKISLFKYTLINLPIAFVYFTIITFFDFYLFEVRPIASLGFGMFYLINFLLYLVMAALNGKFCRNATGLVCNALFPFSVMNLIVLFGQAGIAGLWCIGISLGIAIIFLLSDLLLFSDFLYDVLEKAHCAKYIWKPLDEQTIQNDAKTSDKVSFYKYIAAFFIILALVGFLMLGLLGIYQTHYHRLHQLHVYGMYIPNEDMKDIVKLEKKSWDDLELDDKLAVLQSISDLEAFRLGLPQAPKVVTAELYRSFYNVNYDTENNTIELGLDMVDYRKDGYDSLKALVHGIYYAYEYFKSELVEYLSEQSESVGLYAHLADFRDNMGYKVYFYELDAEKYSELITGEYRCKNLLYRLMPDKDIY